MCGLTGYLNYGRAPETNNHALLDMLALIRHRGPDDSGMAAVGTTQQRVEELPPFEPAQLQLPADLMLGFNRLSILDLSANGHQPMRSGDGRAILLMNGEIYNAFDYREELIQKGYSFRSTTDTEVVLNLYLEYGFGRMIRMLNGMFALALYDLHKRHLFLARDRFGIKPLYVLQENGRLAFSSEMKAFKALPGFRFALAEEHLDEFLLFRNLINRTLFQNIVNLEPGEYWTVEANGQVVKTRYYNLLEANGESVPSSNAVTLLGQTLDRSVQLQLMSDVKLGCQLSGGVDSSLVSYYATQHVPAGQLETISIIFNEPGFSEETHIDYSADHLHLQAHKFTLDAAYYLEQLDRATWHFEQPLNHPNTIGIYLLSQEARKHVTVLLSGEGADEALAGYVRFLDVARNPWLTRYFFSKLKQNGRQMGPFLRYYSNPGLRMIMASAFGSLATALQLRAGFSFNGAVAYRKSLANKINPNCLRGYRQYELLAYLPDLLMRQDKMSMAHSIENRVPFLDNDLIDLALKLPAESLVQRRNGHLETKLVLKQLCAAKFKPSFAFRPKMGFGIPLKAFMNTSHFQEKLNDHILPGVKSRGIFEAEPIRQAATQIQNATADQLESLWLMSGFESWAQQYLNA